MSQSQPHKTIPLDDLDKANDLVLDYIPRELPNLRKFFPKKRWNKYYLRSFYQVKKQFQNKYFLKYQNLSEFLFHLSVLPILNLNVSFNPNN